MGQGEKDVSVRLVGENGMSMSGLGCEESGWQFIFSAKKSSYLVRPPILMLKAKFPARACLVFRMAECSTMCSLEHEKTDLQCRADRVIITF